MGVDKYQMPNWTTDEKKTIKMFIKRGIEEKEDRMNRERGINERKSARIHAHMHSKHQAGDNCPLKRDKTHTGHSFICLKNMF